MWLTICNSWFDFAHLSGIVSASGEDSSGIVSTSGEDSSGIDPASGEDLTGREPVPEEDEAGEDTSGVQSGSEAGMFWLISLISFQ